MANSNYSPTILLPDEYAEEIDPNGKVKEDPASRGSRHHGDIVLASDSAVGKHLQNGLVAAMPEKEIAAAREKWSKGDKRDQGVRLALDALESGRTLIDLHTVIERGGRSPINKNLPALAVLRADLSRASVKITQNGSVRYTGRTSIGRVWSMDFSVPFKPAENSAWYAASAAAPVMPPDKRPQEPKNYLFLWEAGWRNVSEARPPIHIDPALLEHISGTLYRVVDVWDLTELEAAALR